MKKTFIIIVLFALPVTAYIIFASAAHNFAHLPMLTEDISTLDKFKPLRKEDTLTFDNYNTIVCIFGNDIEEMKGNAYNLHEKIYKKNLKYKDFQIIVLAEDGTQNQAKNVLRELNEFTGVNVSKWKFGFGSLDQIQRFFDSLHANFELDNNKSTPFVFVVDPYGNLRGREADENNGGKPLYGYETRSIAALNNTLVDDYNILLAEYRLALKRKEKDFTKHNKEK